MSAIWLLILPVVILTAGIRKIRTGNRGLIFRFGKFLKMVKPGYHWVNPFTQKIMIVNISEQKVEAEMKRLITYDKRFTNVNARVYFKVRADAETAHGIPGIMNNDSTHLMNLTRKILRNIISTLTFSSASTQPGYINAELCRTLHEETNGWGIEIVGTELMAVGYPENYQTGIAC